MDKIETRRLLRRDLDTASLQQLSAARGGTLGIPSLTPIDGFQANLDAQLLGQDANLYTQLGGLDISERVKADAFAELMEQDLPRFLREPVDTELSATKLSTVGLRMRVLVSPKLWVSELQDRACLKKVRELEHSTMADATKVEVDTNCLRQVQGQSFHTVSVGARVMRRSALQDSGKASAGGAFELMYSYDSQTKAHSHSAFGSLSGMRIEGATDMLGTTAVEYPQFSNLRVSAGYEFRGSHVVDGEDALPRVGVYGVASYAWWHGPDPAGTAMPGSQRREIEVGVYLGGKFQKTFQGMLVARLLKPLGSEGTTFILSLIPAGNTAKEIH
ncbi:MAG: hypothetical protein E6J90_18415 [Deltaproteobacteria bacterium]|nr:MAG: hypothetical protein E6J90_18415 [Deltaproteobacteria bacterium]